VVVTKKTEVDNKKESSKTSTVTATTNTSSGTILVSIEACKQ
jgi:hypothetical protein